MRPKDFAEYVKHRQDIEAAERTKALAKKAAKVVLLRSMVEAEKAASLSPEQRFGKAWSTVVDLCDRPLEKNDWGQIIAYTPLKILALPIAGEPVDFSLRLELFSVDDKPYRLSSRWRMVGREDDVFAVDRYSLNESANSPPYSQDPTDHQKSLASLANLETSIDAYLSSDRLVEASSQAVVAK